jgi:hypothetical protein
VKTALLWLAAFVVVVAAVALLSCGDPGGYHCPDPNVCCFCTDGGTDAGDGSAHH